MFNSAHSFMPARGAHPLVTAAAPVKPGGAPVAMPKEEFRIKGLPANVVVQVTYGADTGWKPRRARTRSDGQLRLSVPTGKSLKVHWQIDGVQSELAIAPVGPGATGQLRRGAGAAVPVALSRTPAGATSPAVLRIDLAPLPAVPPLPPVPAMGFRTPPATVDSKGQIQQPPLAKGLLGSDAVMVVGDSLSDDAFHSGSLKNAGRTWAGQLESKLAGAAGQNGERRFVMSVAKHGETVLKGKYNRQQNAGLNARLVAALKANPNPGTVVIALGANDFRANTSAAEVGAALKAAIDLVAKKSPTTRIVLAGVQYPSNYGPGDKAARSQRASEYASMFSDVAAHLTQVAGRTGAPSAFVPDLFKGLRDAQGHLDKKYRANPNEAIHPNALGHARMLATLAPALNAPNTTSVRTQTL